MRAGSVPTGTAAAASSTSGGTFRGRRLIIAVASALVIVLWLVAQASQVASTETSAAAAAAARAKAAQQQQQPEPQIPDQKRHVEPSVSQQQSNQDATQPLPVKATRAPEVPTTAAPTLPAVEPSLPGGAVCASRHPLLRRLYQTVDAAADGATIRDVVKDDANNGIQDDLFHYYPYLFLPQLVGNGFAQLRVSKHGGISTNHCPRGHEFPYYRASAISATLLDTLALHPNHTTNIYNKNITAEPNKRECPGFDFVAYKLLELRNVHEYSLSLIREAAEDLGVRGWNWQGDHGHEDLTAADVLFLAALASGTRPATFNGASNRWAAGSPLAAWAKHFTLTLSAASRWDSEAAWATCKAMRFGDLDGAGHPATDVALSEADKAAIPAALRSVVIARRLRRAAVSSLRHVVVVPAAMPVADLDGTTPLYRLADPADPGAGNASATLFRGFVPRLRCTSWMLLAKGAYADAPNDVFAALQLASRTQYVPHCHVADVVFIATHNSAAAIPDSNEERKVIIVDALKRLNVTLTKPHLDHEFPRTAAVHALIIPDGDGAWSKGCDGTTGGGPPACAALLKKARDMVWERLWQDVTIPQFTFEVYRHPYDEANFRRPPNSGPQDEPLPGIGRRGPMSHVRKDKTDVDYFAVIPATTLVFPQHFHAYITAPRSVAEARGMGILRMFGASTISSSAPPDARMMTEANTAAFLDRRFFQLLRVARSHQPCTPQKLDAYLGLLKEKAPAKEYELRQRAVTPMLCVERLHHKVTVPRDEEGRPLMVWYGEHAAGAGPSPFAFAVEKMSASTIQQWLSDCRA